MRDGGGALDAVERLQLVLVCGVVGLMAAACSSSLGDTASPIRLAIMCLTIQTRIASRNLKLAEVDRRPVSANIRLAMRHRAHRVPWRAPEALEISRARRPRPRGCTRARDP